MKLAVDASSMGHNAATTDSVKPRAPVARDEGPLSRDEVAMLAHLPAGNVALFGGNYLRFQKYMSDSPLSRLVGSLPSAGPGMTAWLNCFIDAKGVHMLGTVKVDAGHVDMRMVMTGMELSHDRVLRARKRRGGGAPAPLPPVRSILLISPVKSLCYRP